MSRIIKVASTSRSVEFRAWDKLTGAAVTITATTPGLSLWYRRGDAGAKVAITPSNLASAVAAYSSGGLFVIDAASGLHRLDLPDAALATPAGTVRVGGSTTDNEIMGPFIELTGYDPVDGNALGLAYLDTTISSRGSAVVANGTGTAASDIQTKITPIMADLTNGGRLDNILDALASQTSVDNAAAAIGTKSSQASVDTLAGAVASTATQSSLIAVGNLVGTVGDAVDAVGTNVDSVLSDTDGLQADWATDGRLGQLLSAAAAPGTDIYFADVQFTRDQSNTQDEYIVQWFKNGAPVTSGITVPTIQVVKRAGGTDLIPIVAMTQIGSIGAYTYATAVDANRQTKGESVIVQVVATIDGSSRTWRRILGRDST